VIARGVEIRVTDEFTVEAPVFLPVARRDDLAGNPIGLRPPAWSVYRQGNRKLARMSACLGPRLREDDVNENVCVEVDGFLIPGVLSTELVFPEGQVRPRESLNGKFHLVPPLSLVHEKIALRGLIKQVILLRALSYHAARPKVCGTGSLRPDEGDLHRKAATSPLTWSM
jgi:hypothetical protein